jgi:hypothetical protein
VLLAGVAGLFGFSVPATTDTASAPVNAIKEAKRADSPKLAAPAAKSGTGKYNAPSNRQKWLEGGKKRMVGGN